MLNYINSFLLGCVVTILVMFGTYKFYAPKMLPQQAPVFVTNQYIVNQDEHNTNFEIHELPGLKKTFDVSVVAYTKELADKMALRPEYISKDLTPGMQSLAIRVKTTANRTDCMFDMLVDNSLPIDFPDKPLTGSVQGNTGIIAISPLPPPDPVMHDYEIEKFIKLNYYDRNNYFATSNYDPINPVRSMMMISGNLDFIDKDWWPGLAWISLREFNCGEGLEKFLELPNPNIWLRNKDGRDYTKISGASHPEDFIKFTIPKALIKRILPTIKEATATQIKKKIKE